MTVNEAITSFENIRSGNGFTTNTLKRWLSELDFRIKLELYDTHDSDEYEFDGYDTDDDTELLAPDGYDDIYIDYLAMKCDLYSGDSDSYNDEMLIFNIKFSEMADYINRSCSPNGENELKV